MPVLQPGARAHIVAPASAPRQAARYTAGVQALQREWTLIEAYAPSSPHGYLSMPDAERAAQLQRALTAPGVEAVLCARGGYGTMRLLPHLDWNAMARATPRWIVGYSDITALQWACWTHLRWPSLSGPVVTEWTQLPAAMRAEVFRSTDPAPYTPAWHGHPPPTPWTTGTARGPLLGGTLSVLTRLLGTPHMPDLTGAILLLEDVQEPPYAVDRMLMHLELAGVLDDLAGVLLGQFSVPDVVRQPTLSMDTVLRDYFADRPYPVLAEVPYGHLMPRCIWPMGVPVRLDTSTPAAPVVCYPDDRCPEAMGDTEPPAESQN
ncbi:LD-carboxypeptidase [Longimonas halophila]|uniref:LD-carboxypeptidase n=2 Tax=Longimonas halophila TaxID=1469170 RepID=A0A2H3NI59_9BACT|nr:LD-carboxypeptidase [Longimonas halophila]